MRIRTKARVDRKHDSSSYTYIVSSVAGYAKVAPLARKVKAGDAVAIERAARMMTAAVHEVVPPSGHAVLVPIPNRTGRAGYTKTLAEKISEATGLPVVDALASNAHTPLYDIKKENLSPETLPLHFYMIRSIPADRVPILIDNVLDTGHTARAAYEAMNRNDTRMAVLGDTHKFKLNSWHTEHYPLITNDMATKKKEKVEQQATPPKEAEAPKEKNAATKAEKPQKTLAENYTWLKEKHPDAVLLFRTGDFYTALNSDAAKVGETLGITVTKPKNKMEGNLSAAFPHHALDTYLPRLIRAGLRVAIVDQLEKKQTVDRNKRQEVKEMVTPESQKAKAVGKEVKGPKDAPGGKQEMEQQEKQPRPPQMVTVNGGKVSHAHAFQSNTHPENWYFVAQIDGKQLHPMKMEAADVEAYQKKETTVEALMQRYYPTKLAKQVSVEEYKAANRLSDGRTIDKMTVYKENDEQRADYGKYKLYAQVGDRRMSRVMSVADQNAFFDRVTTPALLVERNFGEHLHLASAYAAYQLPADIKVSDIRVAKDNQDGKWKISAAVGDGGRTEKKALSFDDGYSLFQSRTATREQLAAKYLGEDIRMMASRKQGVSQGMKV